MDSLLSHLQCRLYSTDQLSSLVATLVDCYKQLANNPTSVMVADDVVNNGGTLQDITLETIIG